VGLRRAIRRRGVRARRRETRRLSFRTTAWSWTRRAISRGA
jgi:hypothetical protein